MSDTSEEKVLLITGAGRGMGTDMAKAALAAGYKTVATGRNIEKVTQAVGASDNLLVVKLDVTNPVTKLVDQLACQAYGEWVCARSRVGVG